MYRWHGRRPRRQRFRSRTVRNQPPRPVLAAQRLTGLCGHCLSPSRPPWLRWPSLLRLLAEGAQAHPWQRQPRHPKKPALCHRRQQTPRPGNHPPCPRLGFLLRPRLAMPPSRGAHLRPQRRARRLAATRRAHRAHLLRQSQRPGRHVCLLTPQTVIWHLLAARPCRRPPRRSHPPPRSHQHRLPRPPPRCRSSAHPVLLAAAAFLPRRARRQQPRRHPRRSFPHRPHQPHARSERLAVTQRPPAIPQPESAVSPAPRHRGRPTGSTAHPESRANALVHTADRFTASCAGPRSPSFVARCIHLARHPWTQTRCCAKPRPTTSSNAPRCSFSNSSRKPARSFVRSPHSPTLSSPTPSNATLALPPIPNSA